MTNAKRFFEYSLDTPLLDRGARNSISDVSGVRVGHVTKIIGDDVRTGVTIVDPGVDQLFKDKLPAGLHVGNGFGKMTGISQVQELGTIETPIGLTNTLAVGPVMRGIVDYVIQSTPDIQPVQTINAVVGETNDGLLNAIHSNSIQSSDVLSAIQNLSEGFQIGCVGAGTGTRAFSWKGGIGTSSRQVSIKGATYTFGVLVQTNYGGNLTIAGVPVGTWLGKTDFSEYLPAGDGSCMFVIATDAPLSSRQLERIAKRAPLALARTGSVMANGSGDYSIAFSTNRNGLDTVAGACLSDSDLTGCFLAAVEACEESVYDAMFAAGTVRGRGGNELPALPVDEVVSYVRSQKQS